MPGSTPATSQLDWLISTTAITVLSWSKATRDLLKSFGWGIRALHQLDAATMVPSPRRLPHTISPVEERVSSEPVSEVGFSGLAIRHDSERFMDDNRSGKGYFGLENGGNSVFAPWQLLLLSRS